MSIRHRTSKAARSPWIVTCATSLLVVLVPLLVLELVAKDEPELRVVETGDRFSALLVAGDTRMLLVNTGDRTQARALLGRIARPWEPGPSAIVAPASDHVAIGVWEVLLRTEPKQLLVAGLPGADPTWHAIERHCRQHDISIDYLSSTASIEGTPLDIDLFVPGQEPGQHALTIRRAGLVIALPLDESPATPASQVLVSNAARHRTTSQGIAIRGDGAPASPSGNTLIAGDREVVRLVIEQGRVRIRGGTLLQAGDANRSGNAAP